MSRLESITIREVESSDLVTYRAIRMEKTQKCGFKIIGKNKDFANGRGEDAEEYILRLDIDQAN
ncbi:MAG TPA: hypothetical protein VKE29_06365 [Candidatus Udaeobacter sp.]|nr:hypothetical protein [Candidatus Udaeobacter sp.]